MNIEHGEIYKTLSIAKLYNYMSEDDGKIEITDIRIERLSESHYKKLGSFKSYEKELVDFLLEDALDNQKKKVSTTLLWSLKSTDEIIGYVTLLTDKISLNPTLKEEFKEKGILYKSLPALKIGRLCVADDFLHKGVGSLMIQFAIHVVKKINDECGCRFITLDAKRNPDSRKDSIHFYRKMEFSVLREREKGTTAMYKDVFKIIENIK